MNRTPQQSRFKACQGKRDRPPLQSPSTSCFTSENFFNTMIKIRIIQKQPKKIASVPTRRDASASHPRANFRVGSSPRRSSIDARQPTRQPHTMTLTNSFIAELIRFKSEGTLADLVSRQIFFCVSGCRTSRRNRTSPGELHRVNARPRRVSAPASED